MTQDALVQEPTDRTQMALGSKHKNNDSGTWDGEFRLTPHNTLIRFDSWAGLNSIIPDLAKSWEWSSDDLHLTMKPEE